MTESNFKMVDDRVAVKRKNTSEKTEGGILIAGAIKSKTNEGTVVAVGPGKKDEPMTVKVGDSVLYGKYAGTEITVDGENYLIMRESDIVAVV